MQGSMKSRAEVKDTTLGVEFCTQIMVLINYLAVWLWTLLRLAVPQFPQENTIYFSSILRRNQYIEYLSGTWPCVKPCSLLHPLTVDKEEFKRPGSEPLALIFHLESSPQELFLPKLTQQYWIQWLSGPSTNPSLSVSSVKRLFYSVRGLPKLFGMCTKEEIWNFQTLKNTNSKPQLQGSPHDLHWSVLAGYFKRHSETPSTLYQELRASLLNILTKC